MLAGSVKRFLDKRTLPICQEAAKAIDPYFDLLGHDRVIAGMMPLQMLFAILNGQRPETETVEYAKKIGSAKSGIPQSVLRLHAKCLFGPQKEAVPPSKGEASCVGGAG